MSKHINHFPPRTGTGHFAPAALPTSRRNCTGHLAARSGNTDFAAQRARANSRPRSGTGHLAPAAAICRPRPGCPAVDLPRTPLPSGRPPGAPSREHSADGLTTSLSIRPGVVNDCLLAHQPIDRFTDEIGLPVVPGVFLDHVQNHPPQCDSAQPRRMRLIERPETLGPY